MLVLRSSLMLLCMVALTRDVPKDSYASTEPTKIQLSTPDGWRRTVNGWEHTSTWFQRYPVDINVLIQNQQDAEPVWMRASLGAVRQIGPIKTAVIQIALIGMILCLHRTQNQRLIALRASGTK